MGRVLEAVYEGGVLRPLEETGLAESQRVKLELLDTSFGSAGEHLAAWRQVYEGFTEDELDELDAMVLDRSNFLKREVDA